MSGMGWGGVADIFFHLPLFVGCGGIHFVCQRVLQAQDCIYFLDQETGSGRGHTIIWVPATPMDAEAERCATQCLERC